MGDGGGRAPPKFELGGTQYTLSPQKLINIMVKYHAPTKTEKGLEKMFGDVPLISRYFS